VVNNRCKLNTIEYFVKTPTSEAFFFSPLPESMGGKLFCAAVNISSTAKHNLPLSIDNKIRLWADWALALLTLDVIRY
jgi:hypothetical protein